MKKTDGVKLVIVNNRGNCRSRLVESHRSAIDEGHGNASIHSAGNLTKSSTTSNVLSLLLRIIGEGPTGVSNPRELLAWNGHRVTGVTGVR